MTTPTANAEFDVSTDGDMTTPVRSESRVKTEEYGRVANGGETSKKKGFLLARKPKDDSERR